jgi:hypothetical protein
MKPTQLLTKYNFVLQLSAIDIQKCQSELMQYILSVIEKSPKQNFLVDDLYYLSRQDFNFEKVDNLIMNQSYGEDNSFTAIESLYETSYNQLKNGFNGIHTKQQIIDAIKNCIKVIESNENLISIKEALGDK